MRERVTTFLYGRFERAFETGRILRYLLLAITAIVLVFGVLMWVVDREDFPTLGLALWWAVSTVTTVGYGDVVPEQPAGRALASGLMVFGYASLSLLTGIVASLLVARRRTVVDTGSDDAVAHLDRRLDEIERLLRERT